MSEPGASHDQNLIKNEKNHFTCKVLCAAKMQPGMMHSSTGIKVREWSVQEGGHEQTQEM